MQAVHGFHDDVETTALAERFAQHREHIRRYLVSRVRDRHAADDLTQETLVRAVHYGRGLRDPQAAVAWLLRIAWHVSLDWTRRRARRRNHVETDGDADAIFERIEFVQEPSPLEADEERRMSDLWRAQLRQTLVILGKLDRVLVIGHYFVGLSCGELAERSGLERDAVKMRLCRARRRLRAALPEGWDASALACG